MKRIEFIDLLKGFAIFLVLWGHSLQYLRNNSDFFHNTIFEFIYSFHMPLFFMISGMFFKSSLKLNFGEFLKKKMIQLLIPCLSWTVINRIYILRKCFFRDGCNINWINEFKLILNPMEWPIWFLRELFISYFLVYVFYKIIKKERIVFLVTMAFVLVIPIFGMQRFLLPMFLIGILLLKHFQFILEHFKWVFYCSLFTFIGSLFFWNGNYTIYISNFPAIVNWDTLSFNFSNIDISIFRLFIGICGSIFFFLLFQNIYKRNWFVIQFQKIGQQTLSIYLIQTLILERIINNKFDFPTMDLWIYNLILTPLISLLLLFLCFFCIKIIDKNKYVNFILFGKSK
jgi:fucose 4-O-acetylase-like acetyltransferase